MPHIHKTQREIRTDMTGLAVCRTAATRRRYSEQEADPAHGYRRCRAAEPRRRSKRRCRKNCGGGYVRVGLIYR